MRGLLGGVVLVLGTGVVGWWGTSHQAEQMQDRVRAGAQTIVVSTVHGVKATVSGRDITVSGIADTDSEHIEILAALDAVNGRRVLHDNIDVLPIAAPFEFGSVKDGTTQTYSGVVPSEAARRVLAQSIGTGATVLTLSSGAPDAAWIDVVGQGLIGLSALKTGVVSVRDQSLTLTGLAAGPTEGDAASMAVAALPFGYSKSVEIELEDDGTPFRLSADYTKGQSASATGKLPLGVDASLLSSPLSVPVDAAGLQLGRIRSIDGLWPDFAASGVAALAALEVGTLQIIDKDLTLTGAGTRAGIAAANDALANTYSGYTTRVDLSTYDDGAPFGLTASFDGKTMTGTGKLPDGTTAADLANGLPFEFTGTIAEIDGPGAAFGQAATTGVSALLMLENGGLTLADGVVSVTGTAKTPARAAQIGAALANLPEGYTSIVVLALLDDGAPAIFDVAYSANSGAMLAGKLPVGLALADVATRLNVPAKGDVIEGLTGDATPAIAHLQALASWLPELASGTLTSGPDGATVTAIAAPGVDLELLTAGLAADFGDTATINISSATTLPEVGAEQVNIATGLSEVFSGAAWVPRFDFAPSLAICDDTSAAVLSASKINFVIGSARLDAKSMRAINAMAGVVRHCADAGLGLTAEIGGHTDSQGSDVTNRALSSARANSVRTALLLRGIGDDVLTSVGYGESQPIADNETQDGRAANRRTSIVWSE